MDDLISRQAAIEVLATMQGRCTSKAALVQNSKIWQQIKDLPSAQQEQRWIPCSERLPEDSQFVLMTIRRMDEHYNHKPFISVGYISWNQSAWWCAHDGNCKSNDIRVDAWMPLPEPYREEGEKSDE